MRKFLKIFNISLFCFILFSQNSEAAKRNSKNIIQRFAIVIGANDGGYNRVKLRYAISDADSFMSVIREMGGVNNNNSFLLYQPDKRNFYSAMQKLYRKVKKAKKRIKKTELFFYYSGHSDEEGILLKNEKITYKEIKSLIKKIPADVRIAILDSCSSGAFTQIKGGKVRPPFLIDSSYDMKGDAIMTSSSKDEASQESDKIKGSFFTHYLVSGLRGAADVTQDRRITLNEAYQFAYNETLTRTRKTLSGPQHANYNIQMSGTGDVILTDIRKSSIKLVLAKNIRGKIFINDKNNKLVAELHKPYGQTVTLGLEQGNYSIVKTNKKTTSQLTIKLYSKKKYFVNNTDFSKVNKEFTIARGNNNEQTNRNTLVKLEDIKWSGFLSGDVRFSRVADTYGTFVGGKAAAILNDKLFLGVAGFGFAHPRKVSKTKSDIYSEEKAYLNFGYGGVLLEYCIFPKELVSYSFGVIIGAGGYSFSPESARNSSSNNENNDPTDVFFVIEPEINIYLNVERFLRLGAGVSYRITNGIEYHGFSDSDFAHPSLSLSISFGWF
jgi:hypothetical protein